LENRVLPSVTVLSGFNGLDTRVDGGAVEPPDTIAAAGPNSVVEIVNSAMGIYAKGSGALLSSTDLGTFFSSVDPAPSLLSDVYVTYDESVGRFFVSTMDVDFINNQSFFLFAVSNDSDPTHGFTEMHSVETDEVSPRTGEQLFTDFPRLGWNADAYVISFNMFGFGTMNPYNVQILTINKSSVLDQNNSTLTDYSVDRPLPNSTMVPATMHGSHTGDPMWFVEEKGIEQNGTYTNLRIVKMTNVLSSNPTFTDFYVQVAPYTITPFPEDPLGQVTTALDTRILSADWRSGQIAATQDVGITSDTVVHARWYLLSTTGSAPALVQQGTITPGTGIHTYMPSIAIAPDGSLGMTYIESSATEFISMYVTGRVTTDAAGTMETPQLAQAGVAGYQGTRAGDFSGINVDPVTGTSFWAANEYAITPPDPLSPNWGTWMANFSVVGLHFAVTAPATATAGTAFSITVTAEDANNNVNPAYLGTVHFTSSDTSAGLPANYMFTAADNGVHTFSNAVTLKHAGSQSVTATDTSNASISGSAAVSVVAAAASHYTLSAPHTATAGIAFTITLMALDPFNNLATGYLGTVHFTSSDSSASVPPDYMFVAADNGVHTFTNGVTLDRSGNQTVTATDTVNSSLTVRATVSVAPGAATHLRVTVPHGATAGTPFTITVAALDAFGNVATGYLGTVHMTSTDPRPTLPADYPFVAADRGMHTFTNGVTLTQAGSQTVTATDTVNNTITGSGTLNVTAGAATHLGITAPTSVIAGTQFMITVTALDAFNNVATGYLGAVHFTSSDGAATLPPDYTFSSRDRGAHTFNVTLRTVGGQTVTATDKATNSITGTAAINVTARLPRLRPALAVGWLKDWDMFFADYAGVMMRLKGEGWAR
jgi:hypothetical protein